MRQSKQVATKKAKDGRKARKAKDSEKESFVNEDARLRYTNLQSRKFLFERGFQLKRGYEESIVQSQIRTREWGKFCTHKDFVCMNWVFEFYANAPFHNNGIVQIREKEIDCSAGRLNEYFQIEDAEFDDYSRLSINEDKDKVLDALCPEGVTGWSNKKQLAFRASSLSRIAKIWQYFVCANVLPTSHTSDLSLEHAFVIYCIVEGLTIDFGRIISKKLMKQATGDKGPIIFPCLITDLCIEAGVPMFSNDVSQPVGHPISGPPGVKGDGVDVGAHMTRFKKKKVEDEIDEIKSGDSKLKGENHGKAKEKKEEETNSDSALQHHLKLFTAYTCQALDTILRNQEVLAKHVGLEQPLYMADDAPFDGLGNILGGTCPCCEEPDSDSSESES